MSSPVAQRVEPDVDATGGETVDMNYEEGMFGRGRVERFRSFNS